MSITKLGNPDIFSPVKNPNYWYFDSSNKNNEGFKYLVDIFSANTSTLLAQYSIWPRPTDGYCEIGLTSLKDYVSIVANQSLSGFSVCPSEYVKYDVHVGEEYVFNWSYTDFFFAGAVYTGTSYPGNVILSSVTQAHQFVVGDMIAVTQNSLSGQSNITGTQVVVEIPSASAVTLGLAYTTAAGVIGGTVTYDDHHKSKYSGLTSYSGWIASNSAVYYQDFMTYDYIDWLISGGTLGRFLTNVPSGYKVYDYNDIYLNFWSPNTRTEAGFLQITNSNGEIYIKSQGSLSSITHDMLTINASPIDIPSNTISVNGGTFPIIKSSTTYFDIVLVTTGFTPTSETLRFNIDDQCFMFPGIEIYFRDRMGSLIPVNFQLNSERSYDYTRTDFTKKAGDLANITGGKNRYQYDSVEAGRTLIGVNETQKITAYKEQLTENERIFFKDLIGTTQAYIKENGYLWPIIITDTNYRQLTQLNENYMPFVINFTYANNNII